MTDLVKVDKTYNAPMTPELINQVLEEEIPDAIQSTMGVQTTLNLAVTLPKRGALNKYGVELIGAKL
ncbi:hypothetical protein SUGI_0082220 [Cryptomeria japonica]|nr:hypothetical protein SUGI_0082220 [Cryptomeria japonica]